MDQQTFTAQPSTITQDQTQAPAQLANQDWNNIPPRPVGPVPMQPTSARKKVALITGVVVIGAVLIGGLFTFVSDKRAEAAQAKLQRESRTVVL